ncbi:RNA polymerase sigma factor [bacterium]|nr:RNA polymerase sigma factor [bacterium]
MKGNIDNELVKKSVNGNEKAFREIITRYNGVVYAAVRSIMGNSDETDDTVQDIFIKIYKGLPRFKGKARFSTWVYSIARNEALNALKRQKMNLYNIEEFHNLTASNDTPEEAYSKKEVTRSLEGYLERLNNNYRAVIELRYLAEKSYLEIADIMDIPIGTVKTYVYSAKLRLKELMTTGCHNEQLKRGKA